MALIGGAQLVLDRLTRQVGDRALVDEVSATAAAGEVVGVLGPNGSGKSTLLRMVYRAQRPDGGRVLLDGEDVWAHSQRWVAQRIGVVLQDMPGDFPLTVRDVVMMGRFAGKRTLDSVGEEDRRLVDAAVRLVELVELVDQPFGLLSGGERQRVLIARALVTQARLLVMDEPTNHLDIHHQLGTLDLVRRLGVTVLVALHDLNLAARYCDRIYLLDQGRLAAAGEPEAVLTPPVLGDIYQVSVQIQTHPTAGTPLVVIL